LAAGGLVLLVVFAVAQRYVAEPVLPGWLFTSRLLNTTNVVSLLVGALLIGLTAYVPIFVQTVLHQEPLVAGFAVAALTLGWPLAASQSGSIYLRLGFRATGLIGSVIAVVGTVMLNLAGHADSVLAIAAACFTIGLGMGLVATPTLIAAQASAQAGTRGVVTGANMFARSLGSAFGVAIYGAVVNAAVAGRGELEDLPAGVLEPPLQQVFLGVGLTAVLLLGFVVLMPAGSRQPHLATQHGEARP
jgi:MFS family permease